MATLTDSTIVPHIYLNNCPLMTEAGVSIKSQINPFAVQLGTGAGDYNDYTSWQNFLMDGWAAGVGLSKPEDGGFLYSELETRIPSKLTLPAAVEYQTLPDSEGCCCHFTEHCGVLYMGHGDKVYEWDGEQFNSIATITHCVTSLAYADGYLHIGQGVENIGVWLDLDTLLSGSQQICADQFYIFGGFLYAICCNDIYYTNGARQDCADEKVTPDTGQIIESNDPDAPAFIDGEWNWTHVQAGPCDECECITGVAGLAGNSDSQQTLLLSTPSNLYGLLPGDVIKHLEHWPSYSENNGKGMISRNGDVYIPVDTGLYRVTQSGQILQMGLDRGEGLPCDKAGIHAGLAETSNWLLTFIDGDNPSIWAWNGEGWHFVACFEGGQACNMHYSRTDQKLYACLGDGRVAILDLPNRADNPLRSDVTYRETGYLDTGAFYGGLREVSKDFHSVYIDGDCISEDTPVDIYWRTDNPYSDCVECANTSGLDGWSHLGTATEDSQELFWPCDGNRPRSKRIYLRVVLSTSDGKRTPIVDAVRLRYHAIVEDKFRWTFTVCLPRCDLRDICGAIIPDYDQSIWDCCIESAVRAVSPVPFTDIDGREYFVRVLEASRAVDGFTYEEGERRYDLCWSFSLQELCPDPPDICK